LKSQGLLRVDVTDKDGRTPLAIAASQGHLNAVKYLIREKANYAIRDARNNDAISDAKREGRSNVVEYLESIKSEAVIHEHCSDFAEGLLRKGV